MKLYKNKNRTLFLRLSFGPKNSICFNPESFNEVFELAKDILYEYSKQVNIIDSCHYKFVLMGRLQGTEYFYNQGESQSHTFYGIDPLKAFNYFVDNYKNYPISKKLIVYKYEVPDNIRLCIRHLPPKKKHSCTYRQIILEYATISETILWLRNIFKNIKVTITIDAVGKPTYSSITVRHTIVKNKVETKSIGIYGLSVDEIYRYVMKNLTD